MAKAKYEKYSPVVIGEVKTEKTASGYSVDLYGHCWKTDKYGSNAEKKDFSIYVEFYSTIDLDNPQSSVKYFTATDI
ncbi:hypothetical protein [Ruminococcus sp. FC2018]|uniref:hypothetical protein n=1 Tax=Ruminococcus sp. FC2018 TaxID=1410617 RepID=UPI00048B0F4D|nr:hypothetical protein [Ruminococcus sp. FC2018]